MPPIQAAPYPGQARKLAQTGGSPYWPRHSFITSLLEGRPPVREKEHAALGPLVRPKPVMLMEFSEHKNVAK